MAVPSTKQSADKQEQFCRANQLMLRSSVHTACVSGEFMLNYGYSDPSGCVFPCVSLFKVRAKTRTMKKKIQWKNKELSQARNRDYVDDVYLSKLK